jgi:hypothetical protein
MSKFTIFSVATVVALGSLLSKPARAFTYDTDDGHPIKHHSGFKMARDRCSMSDNSDEDWAYFDAGWQWGQIQSRMDWNWSYDSGCKIKLGNGRSETAQHDQRCAWFDVLSA